MKNRIIDIIVFPIIVGVILLLAQIIIDKSNRSKKELGYNISEPQTYLERNNIGELKVYIDTVRINSLYSYGVLIKNTGNVAIKDQPIRYTFNTQEKDFKILNKALKTKPREEFGSIKLDTSGSYFARYTYSLINPEDEIFTTFLTNQLAALEVFAKSDDLKFREIQKSRSSPWFIAISSIIGAILALILQLFSDKFIRRIKNVFTASSPSNQSDDIGVVFEGDWILTYTINDRKGREKVKITADGKYYANDNHRFNLHDRIIDLKNKRIIFTKVLLSGQVHAVEDLIIKSNDLIEGKDSLGYMLKYEKKISS
jgi:hypothetical protein